MSEDRVALVEALSKLGLGTLLAGILASVIWFNHSEQSMLNKTMDRSNEVQIKLLTAMEKNQEVHLKKTDAYLELFKKYAEQMQQTGKVIQDIAREK